MTEGLISIDIGTTSIRASVFNAAGQNLYCDQRQNLPDYLDDGRVEQDPGSWERLVPQILGTCAEFASSHSLSIAALSLTAQRSSLIPVDGNGRALSAAIMWQDTRTRALCAEMAGDESLVYSRAGLKITPVFSAIKMRWLREEAPEVYNKAAKLLGIQDYVIHILTGNFYTDRSMASRTNLLNLESLDWDDDLLRLFSVDRSKLCDLIDPGSSAGSLNPDMASRTGLPAGIPVVSAGGDQQCGAVGLGAIGTERIVANTGTASYLLGHSPRPDLDAKMRTGCNVSAQPGLYIVEASIFSTGSVYRWLSETLYPGATGDFEELNREAIAAPAGSRGLLVFPYFNGRGSPSWSSSVPGMFYNLTFNTGRAEMARAVLEGICAELAENLTILEELTHPVEAVVSAGGMAKSDLFNAIQADSYGKTVLRPMNDEATSLGAWISGAVHLGWYGTFRDAFNSATADNAPSRFDPDTHKAAIYAGLLRDRKRIYNSLSASGQAGPGA